jgi:8-hydroxy-5-deazaflavin:NADPH oxidoreductase
MSIDSCKRGSVMSTIGIIGAGKIGQALARNALRAGREVVIANSRGPASLEATVAALGSGVSAGTPADAAAAAIVFLAVPWANVEAAVGGLRWDGQIVVDATNALSAEFDEAGVPTLTPAELGGRTSSEIMADRVSGATVVKAGNTLQAEVLADGSGHANGRLALFLSGDDTEAKATVAGLFADAGFFTVDLGPLAAGGAVQQFPDGPLVGVTLVKVG